MADNKPVKIVIYPFTGWHGLLYVPKAFCEECDLTTDLIKTTVEELGIKNKVKLVFRPWFLWWWIPIWKGAWHAPIVIINGSVLSQGIVPSKDKLIERLKKIS